LSKSPKYTSFPVLAVLKMHVDVRRLIADGIIEKNGTWYRILDAARLPQHALCQIKECRTVNNKIVGVRFRAQRKKKG
jgi:hypothetical protein